MILRSIRTETYYAVKSVLCFISHVMCSTYITTDKMSYTSLSSRKMWYCVDVVAVPFHLNGPYKHIH